MFECETRKLDIVVPHLMETTWERHVHDMSFHVVEMMMPY